MKKSLTLICFLYVIYTNAQFCNCDSVFLSVKTTVENNYAGWFDKMKVISPSSFKQLTDKTINAAKQASNDKDCYEVIKKWVDQFKDSHLSLRFITQLAEESPQSVSIKKRKLSEEDVKLEYDKRLKSSGKWEGIWQNENYKVAILPSKEKLGEWDAIVITSGNENWQSGEVKFTIIQKGNNFLIKYINGNKDFVSDNPVKVVKNILDGKENFFTKSILLLPTHSTLMNMCIMLIQQTLN